MAIIYFFSFEIYEYDITVKFSKFNLPITTVFQRTCKTNSFMILYKFRKEVNLPKHFMYIYIYAKKKLKIRKSNRKVLCKSVPI